MAVVEALDVDQVCPRAGWRIEAGAAGDWAWSLRWRYQEHGRHLDGVPRQLVTDLYRRLHRAGLDPGDPDVVLGVAVELLASRGIVVAGIEDLAVSPGPSPPPPVAPKVRRRRKARAEPVVVGQVDQHERDEVPEHQHDDVVVIEVACPLCVMARGIFPMAFAPGGGWAGAGCWHTGRGSVAAAVAAELRPPPAVRSPGSGERTPPDLPRHPASHRER